MGGYSIKSSRRKGILDNSNFELNTLVTGNRTIIEYALNFVQNESTKKRSQLLKDINAMRMSKRVLLLFELVGIDGGDMTNTYTNDKEALAVEWRHLMYYDITPNANQYCVWSSFKQ